MQIDVGSSRNFEVEIAENLENSMYNYMYNMYV